MLQAPLNKTDCSTGCTMIPLEDVEDVVNKLNSDADNTNDVRLTSVKEALNFENWIYLIGTDNVIHWLNDYSYQAQSGSIDVTAKYSSTVKKVLPKPWDVSWSYRKQQTFCYW